MVDARIKLAFNEVAKLYRYRRFDANELRLLLNASQIRFSDPRRFNDPWDCRPSVEKAKPESEEEWSKEIEIATDSLYMTRQEIVAHPLYHKWVTDPRWARETLEASLMASVDDLRDHVRILCMSGRGDIPLMWSHYADGHAGICLEFSTGLGRDGINTVMGRSFKVRYCDERPTVRFPFSFQVLQRVLLTKPRYWDHELEYRAIASEAAGLSQAGWPVQWMDKCEAGFVQVAPPTSIILGARILEHDEKQVRRLVALSGHPIEILRARLVDGGYQVSIQPDCRTA